MSLLSVSVSPHIRAKATTKAIMGDVLIALVPALVAAIILKGWRALLVVAVCVVTCVLGELVFEKITKKPVTIRDFSAMITGTLLAYSLPVTIPVWQAIVGSLVAIIVVKQLFGGIGQNFANPAVTARIIMFLAFAGSMSTWSTDAVSSATPLAAIQEGSNALPTLLEMFLGQRGGCLGEVCVPALLLGGIYLLVRGVIQWHTPVVFLATVFGLTAAFGAEPVYQVMSGGLVLAAFFMATDYSTTPSTPWGRVIFGFGCGLITVLIRVFGSYPEGVSFAILLMNILTPYISRWTRSKPFGGVKS